MKTPLFVPAILFFISSIIFSQDPFDKDAVTTSLKDAYTTAHWVEDFDRYIKTYSEVQNVKIVSNGCSRVEVKAFCLKPGLPVNNQNTYGYVLGPLKGTKAGLIKHVISSYQNHPEIEQKYVQTLIWGIIAGLSYSDYPEDVAMKIAPLLPDEEKNRTPKVMLKDLLNLPLPDGIKQQFAIIGDIRKLILEGINRYEDLERIAVPGGAPQVSKNDLKIDENCWTLMNDGFYARPKIGGYTKANLDIYKPENVEITYDSKDRIISMQSPMGTLEIEYDDNPGADVISYAKNSYRINRISGIKLNGESIGKIWSMLWYAPFDNKTTLTSTYKRKQVGIVIDPLEGSFNYRDLKARKQIDYLEEFNNTKNSVKGTPAEKELYELKQIEYCMKFVQDSLRFQVKEESIEKIIRIAIDAAVGKFTGNAKEINPKGGSRRTGGFDFPFSVAIPGNNSQRIGVSGNGNENGNNNNENENPPPPPPPPHNPPPEDPEDPVNCFVTIESVEKTFLPAPDQLYAVTLKIECDHNVKEIEWNVYDISREQGRCSNDKDPAFYKTTPDPDLFVHAEDNPDYEISDLGGTYKAVGRSGAARTLYIRAKDYAAFGRVSATIKVRDRYFNAVSSEPGGVSVTIPYDLNENKIADHWEETNGVFGSPVTSDDDNIPVNQLINGDGMTIFDEYRGFYKLAAVGGFIHMRMDPNKKELFIIDRDLLLSEYTWERASGIPVYHLDEQLVLGSLSGGTIDNNSEFRRVNFCRNSYSGEKFAVNLMKMEGIDDPYNLCGPDNDTLYTGCSDIGPPKLANLTMVFPDRIISFFTAVKIVLQRKYDAEPDAESYRLGTLNIERATLLEYLNVLNDSRKFDMLVDFLILQNAVHEVGHACGVNHHASIYSGDLYCPMRYMDRLEELFVFDIFCREIFNLLHNNDDAGIVMAEGRWHFCNTGDNCWSTLNVNDR